jgi:hypothetical protein
MSKVAVSLFICLLPLLLIPLAQSVETEISAQNELVDQQHQSGSTKTDDNLLAEEGKLTGCVSPISDTSDWNNA